VISPAQRPLRDNTQRSQETDIRGSGGIGTRNRSKGEAADLRLRPRDRWDQQLNRKYSMYIVRIQAVRSCATHLNECVYIYVYITNICTFLLCFLSF